MVPRSEWDLEPGSTIKRTELHERFGGSWQSGIAPSRETPNVLIFTDPTGREHGYHDHWEGAILHYCGEGQKGDQEMTRGNLAILEHVNEGRALRVFDGVGGQVTYVGEFGLDPNEPWYWGRAPETGGGPLRRVIMFRLVPVGRVYQSGQVVDPAAVAPALSTPYRDADEQVETETRAPFEIDPGLVERALRGHARTQNALEKAVRDRGLETRSPGFGDPNFDLGWWDGDTFVVAEIKSITNRNEVNQLRLGLGQVLDLADAVRRSGRRVQPVLAIEREPSNPRWMGICRSVDVLLIWPGTFESLFVRGAVNP